MKIAIWDIDNCLADDRHRLNLIDWDKEGDGRYERYNMEMFRDPVEHLPEFNLMRALGCTPVFFTGRPERFRGLTHSWLFRTLGVSSPMIFMRPNGTVGITPVALKQRMLTDLFIGWFPVDIVAAFDDVPAVVDMYRSYGICGVHLEIADHTAAYEPSDLKGALA